MSIGSQKMIEIRFVCHVQEIHEICPPLSTHPGWQLLNTHAQGHTLRETDAIHWSGGQPFTAYGAPPALSRFHQSYYIQVVRVGIELPIFQILDDHSNH